MLVLSDFINEDIMRNRFRIYETAPYYAIKFRYTGVYFERRESIAFNRGRGIKRISIFLAPKLSLAPPSPGNFNALATALNTEFCIALNSKLLLPSLNI